MNSRSSSLLLVCALLAPTLRAAPPRTLPERQTPQDHRLAPPKDLDGYFPFNPPASKSDWESRADHVKRRILVSQGIWPLPTRNPLNAVIHGRIDRADYTVEKVYLESVPGFFVTGNLYRPAKPNPKMPGVLFAHGHWEDARLSETPPAELRREIAEGQERFEQGGRSRFQSLCVQLARMGCIVFQWDMLGNSDAQQISMALAHRFAKQRPEMNQPQNWGLYSPQAEAHLQSIMGLQTWNSVRALDFILSLPGIDPERIAVTGASGGGTQTMLLAGIDPRITLSFPAVMVSTAMQGGCTCENSSLLRIGTGNVEFAALFAPKPQGLTTANDWTRELATKGFPDLKKLYTLTGAPDNLLLHRGEHFPHNYNAVARSAFYTWLNKHFKLGLENPVVERDYTPLSRAELTVWDAQHPAPKAADPDFERTLLRTLHQDSQTQLQTAANDPARFADLAGKGLEIVLNRTLQTAGDVQWELKSKQDHAGYLEMTGLLNNLTHHEQLPTVFLYPKQWNGQTVLWLTDSGKAGLYQTDGSLSPQARRVIDAGAALAGVDLLFQGEFLADGKPLTQTPRVKNPREAAAYTFGYNSSVFAQRVHDVLSVIQFIRTNERQSRSIVAAALDSSAPILCAARAVASNAIQRIAVHTRGFRFGALTDIHHPDFTAGGAKYGDLPGMLALAAPQPTWIAGEPAGNLTLTQSLYTAAKAPERLTVHTGAPDSITGAAFDYLLRP